ncbi:hypothetical protein FRX31_005533 [Thalictrum thalictroides]|uniref:RNase H type-1 domain-containing protein n=1 Tax=Thalictrum thalictroides TaxID=46969 RepID=A0A7J6X8Q6_THATH|nr:hypothetical protein FRX31_005533 [Thalictrum thalictroides]
MKAYTQVQTNGLADCLDSQTLLRRLNIGSLLKERMVKHFQWRKPEEGIIMLNTDGAVNSNGAGIGGILRNQLGEVLCCFTGSSPIRSVMWQELSAIFEGLQLARHSRRYYVLEICRSGSA